MSKKSKNEGLINNDNQPQQEETKYYPTLRDGYLSQIDKRMRLRFNVVHEYTINEDWVYDMMMNDKDVINSEFYQIIKDKKVKVKLNDWGEWDELILDEHTCSVDEYDGIKIRVRESDLWLRLKRNLFDSWYEGDVRTLVGDKWFVNQKFTEDDYKNDIKLNSTLKKKQKNQKQLKIKDYE